MQLLIWFSFSVSLFFQIPQRCYMRIVYAANRPMRAALYTVAWHDKGSNLCQPGHDFYFWIKPFKIGIDLHLLRMIVSSGEVQCGSNNSLQSLSILIVNSKVSHFINHLAGCFFSFKFSSCIVEELVAVHFALWLYGNSFRCHEFHWMHLYINIEY